jgi:hypothetical protein
LIYQSQTDFLKAVFKDEGEPVDAPVLMFLVSSIHFQVVPGFME